jgi:hypothetical protein
VKLVDLRAHQRRLGIARPALAHDDDVARPVEARVEQTLRGGKRGAAGAAFHVDEGIGGRRIGQRRQDRHRQSDHTRVRIGACLRQPARRSARSSAPGSAPAYPGTRLLGR